MKKFETGAYIDNGDGVWSNQGLFMRFLSMCRNFKIDRSDLPYPTEADTINNHPDVDGVFNKFIGALNSDKRTKDGHYWGWSDVESGVFGYWETDPELA